MSKKDPAFLFYSKDWLEGTSEMTSEEKGVYIDLLASQHQKSSLPVETKRLCKLARCGEEEFLKIWEDIKHKFKVNSDNRLVNRKLTEVVTERLERSEKNKIISALAVAVRQSKLPYEVKFEAKKGFNVNDFLGLIEPNITEKVSMWYTERLKSIANANANANANDNNNIGIAPEMFKIFKNHNSKYYHDKEKDFTACLSMAYKIAESKGWEKDEVLRAKRKDILSAWEKIILFTSADNWFSKRALSDLNNEWQRVIQSMNGKFNSIQTTLKKDAVYKPATEEMVSKYERK